MEAPNGSASKGGGASETINLWWIANGVAYGLLAVPGLRARIGFIRFWAEFFTLLLPVSLLAPTNLLFREGTEIMTIGGEALTTYELMCGLIALGFVIVGTRVMRPTLFAQGMIGFGVFVFRATHLHFSDYLA